MIPHQIRARACCRGCRLQDAEAEFLVSIFQDFWAAQKQAATICPTPATPAKESFISTSESPADTGTDAAEALSKAAAKSLAADGGGKATEAVVLCQQSSDGAADVAADMADGASGKKLASVGGCQHLAALRTSLLNLATIAASRYQQHFLTPMLANLAYPGGFLVILQLVPQRAQAYQDSSSRLQSLGAASQGRTRLLMWLLTQVEEPAARSQPVMVVAVSRWLLRMKIFAELW